MATSEILIAVIVVLWSIVEYFTVKWMKKIEKDIEDNKKMNESTNKEMNQIKLNYLDRFTELERLVNNTKDAIVEKIDELKTHISKEFVSKEFCQLKHKELE